MPNYFSWLKPNATNNNASHNSTKDNKINENSTPWSKTSSLEPSWSLRTLKNIVKSRKLKNSGDNKSNLGYSAKGKAFWISIQISMVPIIRQLCSHLRMKRPKSTGSKWAQNLSTQASRKIIVNKTTIWGLPSVAKRIHRSQRSEIPGDHQK